jgi:hypothetical protein
MKHSAPPTTSRMAGIFIAPLQIGGDSPVELHPEHHLPAVVRRGNGRLLHRPGLPCFFPPFQGLLRKTDAGPRSGEKPKMARRPGWLYGYPGPSSPRSPVRACSVFVIVAPQRTTMARNPLLRNHLILFDKCCKLADRASPGTGDATLTTPWCSFEAASRTA